MALLEGFLSVGLLFLSPHSKMFLRLGARLFVRRLVCPDSA